MASKCPSKKTCFHCESKHHSSICTKPKSTLGGDETKDAESEPRERSYKGNGQTVVHPSALATVDGKEVRVVIDTLSSSNYIGSELISKLNLKPKRKERRDIEQMFGDVSKLVEIYDIELQSKAKDFKIKVECINIERDIITQLPNPQIRKLKKVQPKLVQIGRASLTFDELKYNYDN